MLLVSGVSAHEILSCLCTAVPVGEGKVVSWHLEHCFCHLPFNFFHGNFYVCSCSTKWHQDCSLRPSKKSELYKQFHKNMSHYCRKILSRLVFRSCLEQLGSSQTRTELAMHFAPIFPAVSPSGWKWLGSLGRWQWEFYLFCFQCRLLLLIWFCCKEL